MADLEEDIYEAGQEPSPVVPQESVPKTPEDRAISHVIQDLARTGGRPTDVSPRPPQAEPAQDPKVPDGQGNMVPLSVLLDEREKRQNAYQRASELENQLRRYQQQEEQAKAPKTPIAQRLFEDPESVLNEYRQQILQEAVAPLQNQLAQQNVQHDMSLASLRHQDVWGDAWNAWYGRVSQQRDPVTYFRVMNAPSPGEELVAWFKEQRVREQIGDDPAAYRERLRAELLAEMQGEAPVDRASDGKFIPKQQVRLPTATSRMGAAGATPGNSPDDLDGSEDAIFNSARRRSRRDD